MVRHAFHVLTDDRVEDTIDRVLRRQWTGLRKVPDNVPHRDNDGGASRQAALRGGAGSILERTIRPFRCAYNNARLPRIPSISSSSITNFSRATDCYTPPAASTRRCYRCWMRFDRVMAIMLPVLAARSARADLLAVSADLADDGPWFCRSPIIAA